MSKKSLIAIAAGAFLLLGVQNASAEANAPRAEAYFNAISGGNAETVTSFYADNAEFRWVGGPLAGTYKGKKQIGEVWKKFAEAAGEFQHEVLAISEKEEGSRSTVSARVKLIGQDEVPVKFRMTFEDGKIVDQVWQVDKEASYKPSEREAKGDVQQSATAADQPEAVETQKAATTQTAAATAIPAKREKLAALPTKKPVLTGRKQYVSEKIERSYREPRYSYREPRYGYGYDDRYGSYGGCRD